MPEFGGEAAWLDGSELGEWPALWEMALALEGGVRAGVPLWLDCEESFAISGAGE